MTEMDIKWRTTAAAEELYASGDYGRRHDGQDIADAPYKVQDIEPALLAVADAMPGPQLRLADVGCGVGAVLHGAIDRLRVLRPAMGVSGIGFDLDPYVIEVGRKQFPALDLRNKLVESTDGPFDAIMLVDVLEHLENPWEMMRTVRQLARFVIVRQPLLENLSTFRHRNYRGQRLQWGHIAYFSYYSFLDMAEATGWRPHHLHLAASWELAQNVRERVSPLTRILVRANRALASYVVSGFYLNGTFEAAEQ